MNDISTHDYVESSGNVFADMGLEEADELLTCALNLGCTKGDRPAPNVCINDR
jgi:hypothetical protein